jgi:hypothetical protein
LGFLEQAAARVKETALAALGLLGSAAGAIGKGLTVLGLAQALGRIFNVSGERGQVHRDMDRMDTDDEIVCYALSATAARVVGMEDPTLDTFEVSVQAEDVPGVPTLPEGEVTRAQYAVNECSRRLGLRMGAYQIVRRMLKFGNEFVEPIVDWDRMEIAGLKNLPEQTIWPRVNDRGDRIGGWVQRPEWSVGTDTKEIEFAEWELVHFAFGEQVSHLGTPLMKSARRNWKRLSMMEDATAVARMVRSFVKRLHKVPVASGWSTADKQKAIDAYKESIAKRPVWDQDLMTLEKERDPMTVLTDFFVPDDGSKRGGIEMLDPENAQLQNIRDVEHFMGRLITATHMPKRYFPFEGATPKLSEGGGTAEDKHYACLLMMCQTILREGLVKLFGIQLILAGIDPRRVRLVMRMGNISTVDQFKSAQTQLALSGTMERFLKQYPELRGELAVILREFTRMSDASMRDLLKVEIGEAETGELRVESPEAEGTGGNGKKTGDGRVQLPGAGNPEARTKL